MYFWHTMVPNLSLELHFKNNLGCVKFLWSSQLYFYFFALITDVLRILYNTLFSDAHEHFKYFLASLNSQRLKKPKICKQSKICQLSKKKALQEGDMAWRILIDRSLQPIRIQNTVCSKKKKGKIALKVLNKINPAKDFVCWGEAYLLLWVTLSENRTFYLQDKLDKSLVYHLLYRLCFSNKR